MESLHIEPPFPFFRLNLRTELSFSVFQQRSLFLERDPFLYKFTKNCPFSLSLSYMKSLLFLTSFLQRILSFGCRGQEGMQGCS